MAMLHFTQRLISLATAYCGTLFIEHCSSPDLLNHFYKYFEEHHLTVKLLLNLGMDGPNVNVKSLISIRWPQYSASRREDFQDVSNVIGVLTQHLAKHCFSRQISLDKAFVKLIEQFPNLMKYFLKTLHQLPLFNGKHGVSSMARYTRIKTYLTDPKVSN